MAVTCSPDGDLDWSGIRAAAAFVGVREAARRAAINFPPDQQQAIVERIRKRALRQRWVDKDKAHAMSPSTRISPQTGTIVQNAMSPIVPTGSEIAQIILLDERTKTKAAFSRNSLRAAIRLDDLHPDEIIERAGKLRDLVTVAEKAQDWGSGQQAVTVNVFQGEQPADAIEI